jgi:hypothetical protein
VPNGQQKGVADLATGLAGQVGNDHFCSPMLGPSKHSKLAKSHAEELAKAVLQTVVNDIGADNK